MRRYAVQVGILPQTRPTRVRRGLHSPGRRTRQRTASKVKQQPHPRLEAMPEQRPRQLTSVARTARPMVRRRQSREAPPARRKSRAPPLASRARENRSPPGCCTSMIRRPRPGENSLRKWLPHKERPTPFLQKEKQNMRRKGPHFTQSRKRGSPKRRASAKRVATGSKIQGGKAPARQIGGKRRAALPAPRPTLD